LVESNSGAITSNQKASLKIAGAISIEATRTTDPNSIVSKRKESHYRSGRSPDWLKMKNADAPAVKREAEQDWGR
jgi:ATP-dependent DNA ligase